MSDQKPDQSAPTEVWGVAVMAPKQKDAAQAHCFGDCGKISMAGAINDEMTGGLFVCCQPTCPHEAKVFRDYGSTMSFGRPHTVHLRLLNPEGAAAAIAKATAGAGGADAQEVRG